MKVLQSSPGTDLVCHLSLEIMYCDDYDYYH